MKMHTSYKIRAVAADQESKRFLELSASWMEMATQRLPLRRGEKSGPRKSAAGSLFDVEHGCPGNGMMHANVAIDLTANGEKGTVGNGDEDVRRSRRRWSETPVEVRTLRTVPVAPLRHGPKCGPYKISRAIRDDSLAGFFQFRCRPFRDGRGVIPQPLRRTHARFPSPLLRSCFCSMPSRTPGSVLALRSLYRIRSA